VTMSVRILSTVALVLGMVACGEDTPSTPAPPPPTVPAPVPGTLPPAPAPGNQPPVGAFRVSPDPARGEAPLQVRVNMCRSDDPDPGDGLQFSVDFGDGVTASGGCALEHTYRAVGGFQARACVSDGQPGEAHTQCQAFSVRTVPVNLPPDVSNLRVTSVGHSTSKVSFALWDEQEPVSWTATVKAGTPGTSPGCFQVASGCVESASGQSKVGVVDISYRDGIAGPPPGRHFVIITVRSVDSQGRDGERSVEYNVF
jgi:hypothetical protein